MEEEEPLQPRGLPRKSEYVSVCPPACLSVYFSISLSICVSVCPPASLSVYLSVSLFICVSICLPTCLPVCLSVSMPVCYLSSYPVALLPSLPPPLSLSPPLALPLSLPPLSLSNFGGTHILTHCAKHSLSVFSFYLKYIVDTDTLKFFFNAHIKSHIDHASVVWGGSSDALKKRLNSLLRRAGKLILPDKNLTTDQKLNKVGILNLHKQLYYNKGVFMYRALTNSAPVYISSFYKAPHSSSRNNYFHLPMPRRDLFKTSVAFCGALLWNSLPVHLTSCHSLSSFKRNLREHLNTTVYDSL